MSRKIVTNLDLNKNQIQNAVVQPLAAAPANPADYQIYANSTDGIIYQWDPTLAPAAWRPVGAVYNQAGETGAVIVGLDKKGNVTAKKVIELTLTDYTPVEGGYVAAGDTIQKAIAALDQAVKNAVAGGGEVNQNAFSNVAIPVQSTNSETEVAGQAEAQTIAAGAKTDTLTIASGDKWTHVNADTQAKKVTLGHAFVGENVPGSYGDGTHVPKVTVDAAGHVVSAESVEIKGAGYIQNLTSDAQAQIDAKIPLSQKGAANGVATLDANGLVPSAQLPSYVDDVVETYIVGETPLAADWLSKTQGGAALTPETDKIYVVVGPEGTQYLNKQYRWGGTTYVACNPSDVNSVNGKTGIVNLTQDDVPAGETYTQFSKTDKEKLDNIDTGATANTITLNGTETKTPSFYAPAGGGTAGQILVAVGEGKAPAWQNMPEAFHKYTAANAVIAAAGGAFTWTINAATHGIQNPAMLVQLYEAATGAQVLADVTVSQTNYDVTVTINDTEKAGTLNANTYRVVLFG